MKTWLPNLDTGSQAAWCDAMVQAPDWVALTKGIDNADDDYDADDAAADDYTYDDADDDDYTDDDAAADDDNDAADYDADDAAADDDDAADDDADDDDNAYDDREENLNKKGHDMDSGLKIIVTGRGSYYSLVRVCWLRARHGGYDLLSSRVIFGPGRDLADLAKNGLRKGWTIRTACDAEHDILGNAPFRVVLKADESAWAEHCPRPANWEAEP